MTADNPVFIGLLLGGIVLLVLGLVGKVKYADTVVGLKSRVARVILGALGVGIVLTALSTLCIVPIGCGWLTMSGPNLDRDFHG